MVSAGNADRRLVDSRQIASNNFRRGLKMVVSPRSAKEYLNK
jgi:hypothetical protein